MLIKNCKIFDATDQNCHTSILIEDGIIKRIGHIQPDSLNCPVLDAGGRIISPGFIDVHIQGCGGCDVLDAKIDSLKTISKTCAMFGTTGFIATTVFRPKQSNEHITLAAECVNRDLGGANLLGIHLEGPFISPARRGMIQTDSIGSSSMQMLDRIFEITKGRLSIMTIAPELPNTLDIIRYLVKSKVVASFGHSNATYEETLCGFDAGISHVTHLFNAMPQLHHRLPGPLPAIFQTKHVTAQLIPDGVHIHPAVLKMAFDMLGCARSVPITDGLQAMGMPDGKYIYNGIEYESKEGVARYKDGTLIGTAVGMNQLLARLMEFTGCSFVVAVKTVAENPALILGLTNKGAIAVGKDADLVLFDADLSVYTTIVAAKVVYQK